jgi:hypothetical protein
VEGGLLADDVGALAEELLEKVGCVFDVGALALLKEVAE